MSDPPCFRFVLLMESVHRYLICPGRPLFNDLEIFLAYSAQGAHPVFGNIGPCSAGSHAIVGVANFGVIYITAYYAYVFFHNHSVLVSK